MIPTDSVSVLVVEDDDGIGDGLVRALSGDGYRVHRCRTANETLGQTISEFDVILLDLGLPDMDGLDLCRMLRSTNPTTPIVMLTARGSETDIVVGLDAGADDYLVKPFRLAELFARLRANTRHLTPQDNPTTFVVGGLSVDTATRRAYLDGVEIKMRVKEFDLLVLLTRNAGNAVTRTEAMESVWDEHWYGSTKTLDVHIASLRHRLGESGPDDSRITTLRGVGYRLELPSQRDSKS
ncbi:MAG: response regulator transcription factor [Ilumatobacteraceae bacterium]